MKVLEGLGWCRVRQGDGVIVLPLVDASLDVLGPMLFHDDRVDAALMAELREVMGPLLFEMARLAIARRRPPTSTPSVRCAIASPISARAETRYASWRDLLVLLADMTGNRVWQMLARRTREFLGLAAAARGPPATRDAIPAASYPLVDAGLAALEEGRPTTPSTRSSHPAAGERSDAEAARRPPARVPREEHPDERLHPHHADPGARARRPRCRSSTSGTTTPRSTSCAACTSRRRRPSGSPSATSTGTGRSTCEVRHDAGRRRRRAHRAQLVLAQARTRSSDRAHPPHGRVPPEQLPARRAGRAHGGGAARERGAAHRREVLRRDADDGRGATRRGVRPLHGEARRPAADRGAAQAHPRRHARRPATG